MINFRLLSTKSSQIFLNLVFFLFSWRTWLSLICRKNDNIFQRTEYTAERTRELVPWSERCPNRKGFLRDVDVFRGLSFGISIYIFHLHRVLHCTTKGNFGHISLNVSIKSSHKTARKRIVARDPRPKKSKLSFSFAQASFVQFSFCFREFQRISFSRNLPGFRCCVSLVGSMTALKGVFKNEAQTCEFLWRPKTRVLFCARVTTSLTN